MSCNAGVFFFCAVVCDAGQQSDVTDTTCQPCPLNTYKSARGVEECTSCGQGLITVQIGATSPQDCIGTSVGQLSVDLNLCSYC